MGRCIFCQEVSEMLQHGCHPICNKCKTRPNIQKSEYCHTCYNKVLLKNSQNISTCTFSSLHGDGEVALCNYHAYCFECLQKSNNARKIECKNCLNSIQYFCISCRRYCEKNNMIRLHKNHNICNNCKNYQNLKLSCNQCKVESLNDVVKYNPTISQDFYHQKHDQLLKNEQSTNTRPIIEKKSSEGKNEQLKNTITILRNSKRITLIKSSEGKNEQLKNDFTSFQSSNSNIKNNNKIESTRISNNYGRSPPIYQTISPEKLIQKNPIITVNHSKLSSICQIHNQECFSYLICNQHVYCNYCIYEYIMKKFTKFIKKINNLKFIWLRKLHVYGCYNKSCSAANYSINDYHLNPYLINYINQQKPEYTYLLNNFIAYSGGFILHFSTCICCKSRAAIHPLLYCYQCHYFYIQLVTK